MVPLGEPCWVCCSSADLVLSVLQLPVQDGQILGVAEFLLIDSVELSAKMLRLRLQREQRLLKLLHLKPHPQDMSRCVCHCVCVLQCEL